MADTAMGVVFSETEELRLLRSTVRGFLEERVPMGTVRAMMMSDAGFDRGLWGEITELGWPGLAIAPEHGGAGYGLVELGVVLEEMGRLVTPGPFLASAVLATTAITRAATEEQRDALLPPLAAGETIATLAIFEQPRGWSTQGIETSAADVGGSWVLDGVKGHVLDGHLADLLVVAARVGDGVGLFAVDPETPGVEIEQVPSLDPTRRQARVVLDGARLAGESLLGHGPADDAVGQTLSIGVAALASEQLGGAQRCLDMSVDHAKTRHQFGRPIGSFQAIKHRCAEMLMRVEKARSTAHYAARVADDHEELAIASPLAGSVCSEAYEWVAGEMIQVHGGIGFTWEHDAHIYFKRAKTSSLLLGDPRHQRHLLGKAVGI